MNLFSDVVIVTVGKQTVCTLSFVYMPQQTLLINGKACSTSKGGLQCYIYVTLTNFNYFYPASVTYRLDCVEPGRKPRLLIFSYEGSHYTLTSFFFSFIYRTGADMGMIL